MADECIGPYRILAPVAESSQALSFRAIHVHLEREVFLKVLPGGGHGDAERRARFIQEAKALARIDHPAVVRVYDSGEIEGKLYLVSEFLEGPDLRRLIQESGRLPWEKVRMLAASLLDGLRAVHAAGIIHRDIKPSNILIGKGGPKLADFGLARIMDDPRTTQSDTFLGTPAYWAPETLHGTSVSSRSDLFALGATLYEALTGRRAFPGDTFQEVLAQIVEYDPLAQYDEPLAEEARSFLTALLHKDPALRPTDAVSAMRLLARANAGEGDRVRRKRVGSFLAVILLVLVGAAAIIFLKERRSSLVTEDIVPISAMPRDTVADEPSRSVVEPRAPGSEQKEKRRFSFPQMADSSVKPPTLIPRRTGFLAGASENIAAAEEADLPGELWVFCIPWAEISIEGSVRDTTPLLAPIQLSSGRHEITMRHPSYLPLTLKVNIHPTRRETLHVAMADSTAFLCVHTDPWARVMLDGIPVGTTPLSGPLAARPGSHDLLVTNPFVGERMEHVRIAATETTDVMIRFADGLE